MGCCDPKAPRLIRIKVGNGEVGILGLDTIVDNVRELYLKRDRLHTSKKVDMIGP